MKKQPLFIISFFLLFTFTSSAQIKKNATFLGGDISLNSQKTELNSATTIKQNDFSFSPVFGKAIKKNLVLGADATIGFLKNETASTIIPSRRKNYGGGIFLRKYQPLGKSGFLLFFQGRLSYTYTYFEGYPNFDYSRSHMIVLSAYPGISYTVSKTLQLETGFNNLLSMNYLSTKNKSGSMTLTSLRTNSFYINSSLNSLSSIYAGFRILIN